MNDEFKKLIGDIKSIKDNNQSNDFKEKPKKTVRQNQAVSKQTQSSTAISENDYFLKPEDSIEFRQEGVQVRLLKALSRGEYSPIVSIDLHNMTTAEAESYLAQTIRNVKKPYLCCIKVIHGKGYHQTGNTTSSYPTLKNFVYHYLKQHPRVLAFTSTPTRHGGTGAVYVLIKKHTK